MKFFLEKVCPGLDSHMQGHRPQPVNLHYNPKAQYGKDGLQTCVKVRSCKPSETISLLVTLKYGSRVLKETTDILKHLHIVAYY